MKRSRNHAGYVAGGMLLGGILVLVGMALGSSRVSAIAAPQNPAFFPDQQVGFKTRGAQGGRGPTVYTPGTQRAESIYWLQSIDGRLLNLETLLREYLAK